MGNSRIHPAVRASTGAERLLARRRDEEPRGRLAEPEDDRRAREAEARLAAIIETSDDPIIGKTLDGVVTSWNHGAEICFGYLASEMIGEHITRIFPPDLYGEEVAILGKIRRGERIPHFETRRRRKDGRIVDMSVAISPIKDASGRIIGASKVARDITEKKASERALAEAQARLQGYAENLEARVRECTEQLQETIKVLDGFCYTIAHDLRAPLRALGGFSRQLSSRYEEHLDEEGRDYLTRIASAAARMDQLILDLLRLGRLSTSELTSESVQVGEVLTRVILPLRLEIEAAGAEVNLRLPLRSVQGSPILLEQALSNLLGNALKFTQPQTPARVQVWTEQRDSFVRICVRDNGIGIKPQHQRKLFQPFTRLVGAEEYPGTGIGLAIVRKAVERMGGTVGVQSAAGEGACFWLELPAADPSEEAQPGRPGTG